MNLGFCSQWLENVTQPEHVYYYPFQAALFGSLSGFGAVCFTSISFKRALTFTVIAYIINQYSASIFAELFEPYRNYTLGPLVGQVINITISLGTAAIICNIAGKSLSAKQISHLSFSFFLTLFISHLILYKFRQKM